MSQFSQFFSQGAAAAAGVAGNIFAGIRPPDFATFGNSQNFSKASSWMTENFPIPGKLGYILGVNISSVKISLANWNNTLVWSANDGVTGTNSVITAFFYNQVLDKWYMATTTAGAGVYEVNILTGARTLVTATVPAFLSGQFPSHACLSYCTNDGLYEWRDGDTIRKYNQSFVEVQRRTLNTTLNLNDSAWYYTEDCTLRALSRTSWQGQGSSNGTTVTPASPFLLIERFGSRRLVNLNAEMVFSASDANLPASSDKTPMTPTMGNTGAFVGNAVRLGKTTRNSLYIADVYLLDRSDYDRWLNEVADALGMPTGPAFYGDWVNV